jgi:CTP:molybdopterin cytidylyltransferase MocA
VIPAVVIAAGLGTRLRPLTERYAKPVLPLDGQPVVARLLRDLAAAGCARVTVVTGHLAEQVEALLGDGSGFGLEVRYVRQPEPAGSADAVRGAGEKPPYLVAGADTLFADGSIERVVGGARPAGAVAVRRLENRVPVRLRDGLVVRVRDEDGQGPLSGAPLWVVGPPVHERLCLDERPWELANAFQAAIDEGKQIAGIEIGPTRDLTTPFDLLEQNFPYLGAL